MPSSPILPIEWLHGQVAVAWSGVEMALGGGASVLADIPEDGKLEMTPPIWRVASIPFAQFIHIEIHLGDGNVIQLASQLDDGSGFHGLHLLKVEGKRAPSWVTEPGSIYRAVDLPDVPIGEIALSVLRRDSSNAVVEAELTIDKTKLKLISAEVYEREDGHFEICEVDESVLVQIAGAPPTVQPHKA